MNVNELKRKWKILTVPPSSGYESIRIDSVCLPDLFIGLNDEANRCLILEVPEFVNVNFNRLEKENLRAFFHKKEGCVILELLDPFYYELFNELIVSLYNVLWKISDAKKSTENFITTVNKWSAFLSSKNKKELSESEVRGLIGELICLEVLIEERNDQVINSILSAWTGPFDETYDFELEDLIIEVKAKPFKSMEVQISNEFQLDPIPSKQLDLFVVSLIPHPRGISIEDLITSIRHKILSKGGDLTIFYSALSQKNLTPESYIQYDNYRFKVPEFRIYNATSELFPALRKTDFGSAFRRVRYILNLEECTDLIIRTEETNWK